MAACRSSTPFEGSQIGRIQVTMMPPGACCTLALIPCPLSRCNGCRGLLPGVGLFVYVQHLQRYAMVGGTQALSTHCSCRTDTPHQAMTLQSLLLLIGLTVLAAAGNFAYCGCWLLPVSGSHSVPAVCCVGWGAAGV
jgi:hypothetical protein